MKIVEKKSYGNTITRIKFLWSGAEQTDQFVQSVIEHKNYSKFIQFKVFWVSKQLKQIMF